MANKKRIITFMTIVVCVFLGSCNPERDENSPLSILFFADLPMDYTEKLEQYIESDVAGMVEAEVSFQAQPVFAEKLLLEMVAGEGDIYIVDETLVNTIFDPVGLVALDDLVDTEEEREAAKPYLDYADENATEKQLFAIPLDEESQLLKQLELDQPPNMIAVILKRSPHVDESLTILKSLM